jgi:hypothetical protein
MSLERRKTISPGVNAFSHNSFTEELVDLPGRWIGSVFRGIGDGQGDNAQYES